MLIDWLIDMIQPVYYVILTCFINTFQYPKVFFYPERFEEDKDPNNLIWIEKLKGKDGNALQSIRLSSLDDRTRNIIIDKEWW